MILAAWITFGLILLIAIVASVVDYEAKRPKHNVRLPRHTAWDRYNDWKRRHG